MNIEELTEVDELRELVELFLTVWGRDAEAPLNSDTLRAMSHSGNYIAGVRAHGRLIAGIVAWLGLSADRQPLMHSHILGVLQGSETQGLGFALKQHQRRWCLERGVRVIEWTFDPLIRRNAYFNLNKLGAEAAEYLVDFYGAMKDGINAGVESDRILVRWDLESPKARAAAEGRPSEVDAADARPLLRIGGDREPEITRGELPATCEVPDEIVTIRHTDPALARRWRQALRDTLGAHVISGGRIKGVTRAGLYVLDQGGR